MAQKLHVDPKARHDFPNGPVGFKQGQSWAKVHFTPVRGTEGPLELTCYGSSTKDLRANTYHRGKYIRGQFDIDNQGNIEFVPSSEYQNILPMKAE